MTFNWGHKLIVVFLVFGGMMAFMVYRSMKTKYDLVSVEYYKDELSYQKIIDGSNAANLLKTKASVVQEGANIAIRLPDEMKNEMVKGQSWFYCATDAKRDRKFELQMNKNAEQVINADFFMPGNYIVKLTWSSAGRQYYAETKSYYTIAMIQVIFAGFALGLISSFHCVGMCGPLALSLPVHHLVKPRKILAIFLYNIGRVFSYSLIGVLFGLVGRTIYLAGFQQWLSIILGIAMLLISFQYFFAGNALHPKWLNGLHGSVQQLMMRVLQSKNMIGYLMLGMANGLLPCGMVYLAIAGALSATEFINSVLFMSFFGLGTLPAMFMLGFLGMKLNLLTRQNIRKMMPYVAVVMAVILILRGLNLGIPFISPVLAGRPPAAIVCH